LTLRSTMRYACVLAWFEVAMLSSEPRMLVMCFAVKAAATRMASAIVLVLGLLPAIVSGHAAELRVEQRQAVDVLARYDTGVPMAHARVLVFAPENPVAVWLHGSTDADGRFIFVPDAPAGQWTVQVRQAGHGASASFAVDEPSNVDRTPLTPPGPTPAQMLIMVACVVWGFIGTALYFRRRPSSHASG